MKKFFILAISLAVFGAGYTAQAATRNIEARPTNFTTYTVDTNVGAGGPTSITMLADNDIVASYFDKKSHEVKLMICEDSNCSADASNVITLDTVSDTDYLPTVVSKQQNQPVVSFFSANSTIDTLLCEDTDCTTHNTMRVEEGNASSEISLSENTNGTLMMAYNINEELVLGVCDVYGAGCSQLNELVRYDSDKYGDIEDLSLVVGSDNLPVIVFDAKDSSDKKNYLVMLHCSDADCTDYTVRDFAIEVEQSPNVVLDANNVPVITFVTNNSKNTKELAKVLHCVDTECSSYSVRTVAKARNISEMSSTIQNNGKAVISYTKKGSKKSAVRVLYCKNVSCKKYKDVLVDKQGNTGYYIDIILNHAKKPVISYFNTTTSTFNIARGL